MNLKRFVETVMTEFDRKSDLKREVQKPEHSGKELSVSS